MHADAKYPGGYRSNFYRMPVTFLVRLLRGPLYPNWQSSLQPLSFNAKSSSPATPPLPRDTPKAHLVVMDDRTQKAALNLLP